MASADSVQWDLHLLGGWRLEGNHEPIAVASRQQRLIAALALRGSRCRNYVAGPLWPNSTESQASGSLRACLWNISPRLPGLLVRSADQLALANRVRVDSDELTSQLLEVSNGTVATVPAGTMRQLRDAELLPGWYEDWLSIDQERLCRLRLSALETLAGRYLAAGDLATAAGRMATQ